MSSRISLWLFRLLIVKLWFDTIWCHATYFITNLWSYRPVTVSVSLQNMICYSIPLDPLFDRDTSAKAPDSTAAATDGEDRTYTARASYNFASTRNSICAHLTPAWLGMQPDPPPYLRLSHHNTSSTVTLSFIVTDLGSTLCSPHLSVHHVLPCRHGNKHL